MGIVINGRAAASLLKNEGGQSFLNLIKPPPQPQEPAPDEAMKEPLSSLGLQAAEAKPAPAAAPEKTEAEPESAPSQATIQAEPATMAYPGAPQSSEEGLLVRLQDVGKWLQREIPANVNIVVIGSDPLKSDIRLDQDDAEANHVILRRIGDVWYVIECAENRKMCVNGIKKPQAALKPGFSCSIGVGSRKLLLSFNAPAKELDMTDAEHFVLRVPGSGPVKHPVDKPLLIGVHPSCELRLRAGGDFEGIIFMDSGHLMVHSTSGSPKGISVQGGRPGLPPQLLQHLSTITYAGKELCVVELPEKLRALDSTATVQAAREQRCAPEGLAFLELNGPTAGRMRPLPPPGSAIKAGRGSDCEFVVESVKVSRKHAQINISANSIEIIDLGSANGTMIGGERLTEAKILKPGGRVFFADRSFLLLHAE